MDVGQTIVVRRRTVLAVEAVEGTDAAIQRGCRLGHRGAVVVKVSRPHQDRRFDVPTVGPQTLQELIAGRATVLAVEAGATLIIHLSELIATAQAHRIALVGVSQSLLQQMEAEGGLGVRGQNTHKTASSSVLLVAGEASGDAHGAALIEALRQEHPHLQLYGLGGEQMRRAGVEMLGDIEALNVVGAVEVLAKIPRALQLARTLRAEAIRRGTRVAVLIDAPGFNIALARWRAQDCRWSTMSARRSGPGVKAA